MKSTLFQNARVLAGIIPLFVLLITGCNFGGQGGSGGDTLAAASKAPSQPGSDPDTISFNLVSGNISRVIRMSKTLMASTDSQGGSSGDTILLYIAKQPGSGGDTIDIIGARVKQ